jgi:aryl-alcohol dehydrogenase-like predicted oxidoreductase
VLARPGVSSVVLGPRRVEQLEENLTALAAGVNWSAEQKLIDEVVRPGHFVLNQLWGDRPNPRANEFACI